MRSVQKRFFTLATRMLFHTVQLPHLLIDIRICLQTLTRNRETSRHIKNLHFLDFEIFTAYLRLHKIPGGFSPPPSEHHWYIVWNDLADMYRIARTDSRRGSKDRWRVVWWEAKDAYQEVKGVLDNRNDVWLAIKSCRSFALEELLWLLMSRSKASLLGSLEGLESVTGGRGEYLGLTYALAQK